MYATKIIEQTCVGVGGTPPHEYGNCFTVLCDDGKHRRVVNFVLENLEAGVEKHGLTWPIRIKALTDRVAVVHDERIPDNWYSKRFCEVCCPTNLLPLPQLLAHERQIAYGDRTENGRDIVEKYPGLRWE